MMQAALDVCADARDFVDSRIGCEVGLDYRIVRHLASGGMANVFLAEHTQHGGRAAVKFIDARSGAPISLLQHEARVLARLRHPNVVRPLELGRTRAGSHYLLLEYVRGIDLAEWLTLARPTRARARWLEVLKNLAAAIDYLHVSGFVHADIKPSNVMFDPNAGDKVTLIDFGLAFERLHASSLMAGHGTPGYMAPEQVSSGACGPASDRYALAVVAYELLTGVALAPQSSGAQRVGAARSRFDLSGLQNAYAALVPVFKRALHDDPDARFDSARAFVAALAS
ncbi:MAG: hypothetical protein RL701_1949 [Pseudomonadota bacterium]|jgi:serine/threonine-protein kinase